MVNHYYVYAVDRDFGPFSLKFCSYFPYNAKLCLNGHAYLKLSWFSVKMTAEGGSLQRPAPAPSTRWSQ